MRRLFFAALLIFGALWVLFAARSGVEITRVERGATPTTVFARAGADGPYVLIAHGFAGSQQMMQGYALPLARAGYRVHTFDFLGHGRNPVPMSGDVTVVDGTTRLLMSQVHALLDQLPPDTRPVTLIGHSMATDILVRVAGEREDVGPMVLISAFSQEITAAHPANLLMITGAWESGLRGFARKAVKMIDPAAQEGQTVEGPAGLRRAVVAPASEHVAVLQSRIGRQQALAWVNQYYGQATTGRVLPSGWALLALFLGLVLAFRPIGAWLPARPTVSSGLTRWQTGTIILTPMVLAPLVAVVPHPAFLPVLVADHLMLHLLVFGGFQLGLIWRWRVPLGRLDPTAFAITLAWAALFGLCLNAFAANFWPSGGRWWIVAVIALGAVPYMLADAVLAALLPFWRHLAVRGAFVVSLAAAVALDFEGLFFLVMIAPVMVLFYLIFGTVGRIVALRSGPLAPGLALGLALTWALGVSFPLFQA